MPRHRKNYGDNSPWFDKEEIKPRRKTKVAYPVYEKTSSQAQDFRSAFRTARKSGAKTFEWEGRKYTTKVKGE